MPKTTRSLGTLRWMGILLLACMSARAQKVTLIAVGDINLSRGVERAMAKNGSGYPFAAIEKTLHHADIVIGNLECCLAVGGKPVAKKYNFRGKPGAAVALKNAGFTVVTLANNHSLDYGRSALGETIQAVRGCKMQCAGAGVNVADAHTVRVVTVRGMRVGFLSYLGLFPSVVPLLKHEPAVAMADIPRMRHDIRLARKRVDFLVVSIHAGKEYTFKHTARQQAYARAAIDAGADLVIGHHPHVVQDVEVYKGRKIYYSLGNFVFDPSPQFLKDRGRKWSAMVRAELLPGGGVKSHLVPLKINNRQVGRIIHHRDTESAEVAQREVGIGCRVSKPRGWRNLHQMMHSETIAQNSMAMRERYS